MRTVALATLVADARSYADQIESDFRTDAQVERLINQKLAELYDLLLEARGQDYYITSDTIAVESGTSVYALPADFYQLKVATLEWSTSDFENVRPINSVAGRTGFLSSAATWSQHSAKGYRLRGANIEFLPSPTSAVTCRVQYVPHFADLDNSDPGVSDVFDGVNGWEKLVTLGVAMELMEMEEAGTSGKWAAQYEAQYERIQAMAADRDADQPMRIEDVNPDGRGGRGDVRSYGNVFGSAFGDPFA